MVHSPVEDEPHTSRTPSGNAAEDTPGPAASEVSHTGTVMVRMGVRWPRSFLLPLIQCPGQIRALNNNSRSRRPFAFPLNENPPKSGILSLAALRTLAISPVANQAPRTPRFTLHRKALYVYCHLSVLFLTNTPSSEIIEPCFAHTPFSRPARARGR